MGDAFTWLQGHWVEIGVAALAVSGAFAQVAQLTPWGWDDEAAGWLKKIVAVIAGNAGTSKGA